MSVDRPESLENLVRRTRAVADPRLHVSIVGRFLAEATAGEAVESLRLLMADLDRPGYRGAYRAVVEFFVHRKGMRYAEMGDLYRAAYSAGYAPVRFLLLNAPPRLVAEPDEVLPDPELVEVPLGRRKTMAKSQERDLLLRLALDPEVSVVQILLQNPRLVEADVIRLAARRPSTTAVLEIVARHPRWSHRYDVQRAIAQNPYARTMVAVSMVPFLMRKHLREVANDARLHDGVREAAGDVSRWRTTRKAKPAEGVTRH